MNTDQPVAWCPLPLTEHDRQRIWSTISLLGEWLRDPERVMALAQIAARQSQYGTHLPPEGFYRKSLAHGPLGVLLCFHEMQQVVPYDRQWKQVVQAYIPTVASPENGPSSPSGLSTGWSGWLFVAHLLSMPNYQETWQAFQDQIHHQIMNLTIFSEQIHSEEYVLATGAVGWGTSLLFQAEVACLNETIDQERVLVQHLFLTRLTHHLCWLARRDVQRDVCGFAHWYQHPLLCEQLARIDCARAFPGVGLYTGLSGLLAFLSLVQLSSLTFDTTSLSDVLRSLSRQVQEHVSYPLATDLGTGFRPLWDHLSWGIGCAGVVRALWLAGVALDDADLRNSTLNECRALGHKVQQISVVHDPSLKSGLAGVLLVFLHMASDTADEVLIQSTIHLIRLLLDAFEEGRPFGYRSFEPGGIRVDSPWLFEGAAGILLSLLGVVTSRPPSWTRLLLLA